jgi:hypothetical protein
MNSLYPPERRAARYPNTYLTAVSISETTATVKTLTMLCTLFDNNTEIINYYYYMLMSILQHIVPSQISRSAVQIYYLLDRHSEYNDSVGLLECLYKRQKSNVLLLEILNT